MTCVSSIKPKFVEYIPENLVDGVLYVSMSFSTAAHRCCCGCGNKVVTPLSPAEWKLTFDDETVTLYPSIGNWGFPCKSHYWIRNNHVSWARRWSESEIHAGRIRDEEARGAYYTDKKQESVAGGSWRNLVKRWFKR